MPLSRRREDPTLQEVQLHEINTSEILLALEPIDSVDELPLPLPPVVPPPPPGHDLIAELGPVEDLWDACADTVTRDFSAPHLDGVERMIDEYLTLEQNGQFGDLPGTDQQRLIQALDATYSRR